MYYIYIYLDPLKPGNYFYQDLSFEHEPFYVGRGKNYRFNVHIQPSKLKNKSSKNEKILEIKKNGQEPIINFYSTGLTFEDSLNLEREYIYKIGRKSKNEGPLTNLTSGGQGVVGLTMSNLSIEKMKKTCVENGWYKSLSKNMSGELNSMSGDKWHRTEEGKLSFKNKMSGISTLRNKTQEEKKIIFEKISKTLTGYEWSDKEKEKRKIGMLKVWKERRKNNVSIIKKVVNVKITDIVTNEELIFRTKKEASEYLKVNQVTVWRRYKNCKIVNNKKIDFLK